MRAVALLALVASAASPTYGDELPRKLEGKDPPLSAADKERLDARLRKMIGKPAEPIVNLRNIWTHETLVFYAKAASPGIDQETLDTFLRCHFTDEPSHMDPRLIGVLVGAAKRFAVERIDIVSGFRSPKFNLMLRKKGHEVARDSQHTYGHAVDFRVPGVGTRVLLDFVKRLHLGGAGFYPESEFVHADTGPVRYWAGR